MPKIEFISKRWDYDNGTALCLDSTVDGVRWRIDVRFQDSDSWSHIADRFRNLADNIEAHGEGKKVGKIGDEVLMERKHA